jgi:hypothetical protein
MLWSRVLDAERSENQGLIHGALIRLFSRLLPGPLDQHQTDVQVLSETGMNSPKPSDPKEDLELTTSKSISRSRQCASCSTPQVAEFA